MPSNATPRATYDMANQPMVYSTVVYLWIAWWYSTGIALKNKVTMNLK